MDPDPAFYLNADLDPGSQISADPDSGQTLLSQRQTKGGGNYWKKIALQSSVVNPHWRQCADPDPGSQITADPVLVRLCGTKKLIFT